MTKGLQRSVILLCNLITVHSQLISRTLRRVHSHPLTALINWHAYLCRGHLDYSSIVFLEVEFVVYTLLYAIYRFTFNKTLIHNPICCFLSMADHNLTSKYDFHSYMIRYME
ncbi:hypothetical protein Hanom_Chr12g01089691 [Helianthus anomalus]